MNFMKLGFIISHIQEETVLLLPEKKFPTTEKKKTDFCGFLIKTKEHGEIGFQVKKLNDAITKKQNDWNPFFVSSVAENERKTMIYVTLNRKNVIQTLLKHFCLKKNEQDFMNTKHETEMLGLVNSLEKTSFSNSNLLETKDQQDKNEKKSSFNNSDLIKIEGQQDKIEKSNILLISHVFDDLQSVVAMRISLLTHFLHKLTCSNLIPACIFSEVDTVQYMHQEKFHSINLYVKENFKEVEDLPNILKKLCDSKYCLKNGNLISIDGKRFLNENFIGEFLKDIRFIPILLNNEVTNVVKVAACINSLSTREKQKMVHILPQKYYHSLLQSYVLLNIINPGSLCTFSTICIKNTKDVLEEWLSLRKQELLNSYISKFGKNVQGNSEWEAIINNTAMSSIKLDLFSLSETNAISINKIDSRRSLFIMYNYARICKLLKTHQELVTQGVYPPIMEISNMDFTVLSLQSEWCLVLYILDYCILLSNLKSKFYSKMSDVDAHQIYKFLYYLSRDISSYYHQTKILLESRDHLFGLISARLYLSVALKEVANFQVRFLKRQKIAESFSGLV
nr:uncharacterized protein LOC100201077 isoform X1 [Hydra vulgaris]